MQLKRTLRKATELGVGVAAVVTLTLAGCGGGATSTRVTTSTVTQLSGTNGDMTKYLGVWLSECGTNISPPFTTLDGVTNRFDLTAISGAGVLGTLTATTYPNSTSCTGGWTQAVAQVSLQYASNVVITTPAGKTALFSGSADRINYRAISGVTTTPYNFGFRSNFSQFQLTSASSAFSTTNLIYTKQ